MREEQQRTSGRDPWTPEERDYYRRLRIRDQRKYASGMTDFVGLFFLAGSSLYEILRDRIRRKKSA